MALFLPGAGAGASAALVGLIFVSISISLSRILAVAHLPARAMEALLDLLQIFIVASLMLVPQPTHLAGIEIAVTALAIWVLVTTINLRSLRRAEGRHRARYLIRVRISHVVNLLYVGAGIAMAAVGPTGIYVLVPAVILSYLVAVIDAWVLLIEVNR